MAGSYTVRPGDTLWRISREQGVDLTTLTLANHLKNTALHPGQRLIIPELHVAIKGDTLWSLARRYNTTVAEIKVLNGLQSNELRVGQRLWIPAQEKREEPVNVIAIARSYLGYPYRYGGAGPNSFDCSGFVQYVYGKLGIKLPRTAAAQWSALPAAAEPEPGDLVFFSFSGNRIDHVGIYLGNGRFIHANSYKKKIVIEDLNAPWYQRVYRGSKRVNPPPQTAIR